MKKADLLTIVFAFASIWLILLKILYDQMLGWWINEKRLSQGC